MVEVNGPPDLFRARTEPLPPRVEEFRRWIVATMPCVPDTVQARGELDAMSFPSVVIAYLNWVQRLIPARPRRVSFAPEFWDAAALAQRAAVETLAKMMEHGDDLTPYLSDRAVREGYLPTRKGKPRPKWEAKDFALNAWWTHHLHLAPKGTRELLYATFDRSSVELLMVGDHKSFDDGSLERRMAAARAAKGRFVLKGVTPYPDHAPMDRVKLARYGVMTMSSAGNQAILGAFMATDGTSVRTTQHMRHILGTLRTVEANLDKPGWLRSITTPPTDMADPKYRLFHSDLFIVSAEIASHVLLVQGLC
jgi:hypothetical protein